MTKLEEAVERAQKDASLTGTVDDSLIRKARLRITGANIHEAIGLIARMGNHHHFLTRQPNRPPEDNEFVEKTKLWIVRDRKFLMHFVKTGIVPTPYNNYCGLA